jgi:hypothetical protein
MLHNERLLLTRSFELKYPRHQECRLDLLLMRLDGRAADPKSVRTPQRTFGVAAENIGRDLIDRAEQLLQRRPPWRHSLLDFH